MKSAPSFLLAVSILLAAHGSAAAQTGASIERDHAILTLTAAEEGFFNSLAASAPAAETATLGVSVDRISDEVRARYPAIKPAVGLCVRFLVPDGPAAAAKIAVGDILLTFGEHPLVHPEQLRVLVAAAKPGDAVVLTYLHQGQPQQANITLGKALGVPFAGSAAGISGIQSIGGFVIGPDGQVIKLPEGGALDIPELLKQSGIDEEIVQEALRQLGKPGVHENPSAPGADPGPAPPAPTVRIPAQGHIGFDIVVGAPTILGSNKFIVVSPSGDIREVTAESAPELEKSLQQLFKPAPQPPTPERTTEGR